MKRQAVEELRAAIEANTQRRTLDELKAQGKRHVRVVSGDKVMKIITAIVNDVVARQVGEITERDRDRIVSETKGQFDRVLKMQSEQDDLIKQQKDLVAEYQAKFAEAQEDRERLTDQVEELRSSQTEREAKTLAEAQTATLRITELERDNRDLVGRLDEERKEFQAREQRLTADHERIVSELQSQQQELVKRFEAEQGSLAGKQEHALAEARARASELEGKLHEQTEQRGTMGARLERLEQDVQEARAEATAAATAREDAVRERHAVDAELAKANASVESFEREFERMTVQVNRNGEIVEELKSAFQAKQAEVDRLAAELADARRRADDDDSAAVSQLRGEMNEMKSFLMGMEERSSGANENTVQALMERLSEQQTMDTGSLEDKFSETLEKSLDQITRTMELATAKPIDTVVEATDVLVGKLFDSEVEMTTNLEDLDVQETTSKSTIGGSLARLKAMRAGAASAEPKAEPAAKEPAAAEPEAADEPVSGETKQNLNASMERLKAVRDGENKE